MVADRADRHQHVSTAARPHGRTAALQHGSTAAEPCSRTAARPHGRAAAQPHGSSAARPHGRIAARPCGSASARPHRVGRTAARPCGSASARPPGRAADGSALVRPHGRTAAGLTLAIQRQDPHPDILARTLRREPLRESKDGPPQYISDLSRYIRLRNGASPRCYQRLCDRLPWSYCLIPSHRKEAQIDGSE